VREIFAWYAEAHSFCSVAQMLEQRGIRTSTGLARWNLASLRALLTNPTYAGRVYGNRWHPPRHVGAALGHEPVQALGHEPRGGLARGRTGLVLSFAIRLSSRTTGASNG
jgi:hypothetical protein